MKTSMDGDDSPRLLCGEKLAIITCGNRGTVPVEAHTIKVVEEGMRRLLKFTTE
jgi:hypothetical protein